MTNESPYRRHEQLGLELEREGRLDEAERSYRKAIEAGPLDAEVPYRLALILEKRGEYASAAEFYRLAMELGDEEYAPMDLAKLLWEELDCIEEAEKLIVAACDRDKVQGYVNLGALRMHQGRLDEADGALRKAIEIGDPYAHLQMGRLLAVKKRREEARAEYLRASKGSLDATTWWHLAWGLFDLGYGEDAERMARNGLRKGDPRNYRLLGRLMHERGASKEAKRLFDEAIELDRYDVLVDYGVLERDLGQAEQAERLFRQALKMGDDDAHLELARLFHRMGRYSEAELEYQAAISAKDEEAYRAYGQLLIDQGRLEQARECFSVALDKGDKAAADDIAALNMEGI